MHIRYTKIIEDIIIIDTAHAEQKIKVEDAT
jgi:hypothetical protein